MLYRAPALILSKIFKYVHSKKICVHIFDEEAKAIELEY